MARASLTPLEIWAPLPPLASGVADYVAEQLEVLEESFALTLVAENPSEVDPSLRNRHRVIAPEGSDPALLRLYHAGNSPVHGYIYREAVRQPGVVVLHEWNLHELLLGFAVASNEFSEYQGRMRREHGTRGSVAAGAIATALGGRHWPGAFPLNAELLERSLALVCLAGSSAVRAAARVPGTPVLHLPHHAELRSHASNRSEARDRLGVDRHARVVLAPGLGTTSKALDVVCAAVDSIRDKVGDVVLMTAGGGPAQGTGAEDSVRSLGRVDLETLGDALLAADVVVALRFPSRGEASGVVMRGLAAGRALIVSTGSTSDEDLPEGVVARVNPGPSETRELAALLKFLLMDETARLRMERLSLAAAAARNTRTLTKRLADFLASVAHDPSALESRITSRKTQAEGVRNQVRDEIEAAASSLGLAHIPSNVFERLTGL